MKKLSLRKAAGIIGCAPSTLKVWIDNGTGPPAVMIEAPGSGRSTYKIDSYRLDVWLDRNTVNAGEVA